MRLLAQPGAWCGGFKCFIWVIEGGAERLIHAANAVSGVYRQGGKNGVDIPRCAGCDVSGPDRIFSGGIAIGVLVQRQVLIIMRFIVAYYNLTLQRFFLIIAPG